MKKVSAVLLLVVIGVAAWAQTAIDVAFGVGTVAVGGNVGAFNFGLAKYGHQVWGGAAYAEVDSNGSPLVQVFLPMATSVAFGRGTVAAEGLGLIMVGDRQLPVTVAVRGAATSTSGPGSFGTVCSIAGIPVYRAGGDLAAGRVVVRHIERR